MTPVERRLRDRVSGGRRKGRPLIAERDSERCEALTVMTRWKVANKREQRCPFVSKYVVGSKELCRHHAVMEAMAIAIERGQVRRIPRAMPRQDQRVPTVRKPPSPPIEKGR